MKPFSAIVTMGLALLLGSCSGDGVGLKSDGETVSVRDGAPQRIVSLDYCSDQYVLEFADRAQILALSPDATRRFSALREQAEGLPSLPPRLEPILLANPDLVVLTYGGGPNLARRLEALGIETLRLPYASDILGIEQAAQVALEAFGKSAKARTYHLTSGTEPPKKDSDTSAIYITPSGVTAGAGTLVDNLFRAGGLRNIETRPGWHPIPLERLVQTPPEMFVTAFFHEEGAALYPYWSPARHPALARLLSDQPVIALDQAELACAAPATLNALRAIDLANHKGGAD